jgi:hypothetical protein
MNIHDALSVLKSIKPDYRYEIYKQQCELAGVDIFPLDSYISLVGQYVVVDSTYGDIDFLTGLQALRGIALKSPVPAGSAGCGSCGGGKVR